MKDLFDTKEKIDAGLAAFTVLVQSPGWKLFEEILDQNIEVLSDQIINGSEDESIEVVRRLRDKLQAYKDVRNTPHDLIAKFQSNEDTIPEDDPFDTVESLKAKRDATI